MITTNSNTYSGSFVAGALLHDETTAMLPLLMHTDRTELVKQEIEQNQYLHIKAKSARQRVMVEINKRFDNETIEFWEHYRTLNTQEQYVMLLYVVLDTYKLLFDFHVEVSMEYINEGKKSLLENAFQVFINTKTLEHPELSEWTEQTVRKCISVYLTMLRQAGLLAMNSKKFKHISLEEDFYEYFIKIEEIWFLEACFLSREKRDAILKNYLIKRNKRLQTHELSHKKEQEITDPRSTS